MARTAESGPVSRIINTVGGRSPSQRASRGFWSVSITWRYAQSALWCSIRGAGFLLRLTSLDEPSRRTKHHGRSAGRKARPDLVNISTVVPLYVKDAMLAHRDATGESLGIIIEKGVCKYLGITPET